MSHTVLIGTAENLTRRHARARAHTHQSYCLARIGNVAVDIPHYNTRVHMLRFHWPEQEKGWHRTQAKGGTEISPFSPRLREPWHSPRPRIHMVRSLAEPHNGSEKQNRQFPFRGESSQQAKQTPRSRSTRKNARRHTGRGWPSSWTL